MVPAVLCYVHDNKDLDSSDGKSPDLVVTRSALVLSKNPLRLESTLERIGDRRCSGLPES